MPNPINCSQSFGSNATSQGALIVPDPASLSKYYVFNHRATGQGTNLQYFQVDMTLNGGLGDIVDTPDLLLNNISDKLTGTIQANGKDYWITVHLLNSDSFFVYPLTSSGIGRPIISKIGSVQTGTGLLNLTNSGYAKISPNGKKLAVISSFINRLEIFDFDPSTGLVSNGITKSFPPSNFPGLMGIAFSPNSMVLYMSFTDSLSILQYDLSNFTSSAVFASERNILINNPTYVNLLQLAPNGKIYGGSWVDTTLIAISNPNILGLGCNVVPRAVSFSKNQFLTNSLPNLIDYVFSVRTTEQYIQICPGDSVLVANHYYNIPGIYNDTIPLSLFTDSIIRTILSLHSSNINLNAIPDSLISRGSSVEIQALYDEQRDSILYWLPTGVQVLDKHSIKAFPKVETWFVAASQSNEGCFFYDSILVSFLDINLPNAFTPNGDGQNDLFIPRGKFIAENIMQFRVYNRWGECVFNAKEGLFAWDGTYKGTQAPIGSYTYLLEYKNPKIENSQIFKGSVELIR